MSLRRTSSAALAFGLFLGIASPITAFASNTYDTHFEAAAKSKALCEADPARVHVTHKMGSACIAYTATRGHEPALRTVLYFGGDVPIETYKNEALMASNRAAQHKLMQWVTYQTGVRIVHIERIGINGSSGTHAQRRRPEEIHAMNAVVDALKARLGLSDVVLAGQSGGSFLAASLLTLGRRDVSCAVLGSGVYEHARFIHETAKAKGVTLDIKAVAARVYDPSIRTATIAKSPHRRVFVLGDPADLRTPFDQQSRFAERISGAGHHARVLEIQANDPLRHGATRYALHAAAYCAAGHSDETIRVYVAYARTLAKLQAAASPRPQPGPQASTNSPAPPARN